ncbi:MAG: hypothetical protein J3K34DRAFT_524228 [Monoraphidium minutum]|nr:MAG: hypothetical protein J3K34DRAFT_524228 [Monoraphidium minutum]
MHALNARMHAAHSTSSRGWMLQHRPRLGGARPRRFACAAAGPDAPGDGSLLPLDGDWRVFKARLIERAGDIEAQLDPSTWCGGEARADVRLRVVVSGGSKPRAAAAAGDGGGGSGSSKKKRRAAAEAPSDADDEAEGEERPGARGGAGEAAAGALGAGGDAPAAGADAEAAGRRVVEEMPGHAALLREASGWARSVLSSCPGRSELDVVVEDEHQAAAAGLLLRCIYSGGDPAAPLEGAGTDMLLQVLRLASRLQVPAAARAASHALLLNAAASSTGRLPWEAVTAAFELQADLAGASAAPPPAGAPAEAAADPDAAPAPAAAAAAAAATAAASWDLREAAREALLRDLGDLDLAWLDAKLRERLLALPFEAVRTLLSDGRTRAASEATVFYTADAWLHARRGGRGAPKAQAAALARCVRVAHLPLGYLTGVAAQAPWFTRAVGAAELLQSIAYRLAAGRVGELSEGPAVAAPPPRDASWLLPPRRRSRAARLAMEWDVPLALLKRLHKAAARQGPGGTAEAAAPRRWAYRGLAWALEIMAEADEDGAVTYGLYVTPSPPPMAGDADPAAAAVVEASVTLDARCALRKLRCGCRMQLLVGCEGRGFEDMFEMGARATWDEAAWRRAGLVGEDGCVRVTATVKDVK